MKLTFAQAIEILIDNAAANVAGCGVGIRPTITEKKRQEVVEAITKVWPRYIKYRNPPWFNFGLTGPEKP